jgi:hypothetical protein
MFYHIWIKFGLEDLLGMLLDSCEFRDNGFSKKHDSPWYVIFVCSIFKFFYRFYKILYRTLSYDSFLEAISTFVITAVVKATVY